MSFGKLLGLSRSFVAGRTDSGRYKMAEQGMLPRFGAPVNQVAAGMKQKPVASLIAKNHEHPEQIEFKVAEVNRRRADERSVASGTETEPSKASIESPKSCFAALAEVRELIKVRAVRSNRPVPASTNDVQSSAGSNSVLGKTAFAAARSAENPKIRNANESRLSRLLFGRWLQVRNDPFKSRDQLRSIGGQQPELSLDQVRVVRNDLADSDFEILTTGNGVRREDERGICSLPVDKSIRSGSSGLATRLFNAVRVRV